MINTVYQLQYQLVHTVLPMSSHDAPWTTLNYYDGSSHVTDGWYSHDLCIQDKNVGPSQVSFGTLGTKLDVQVYATLLESRKFTIKDEMRANDKLSWIKTKPRLYSPTQ